MRYSIQIFILGFEGNRGGRDFLFLILIGRAKIVLCRFSCLFTHCFERKELAWPISDWSRVAQQWYTQEHIRAIQSNHKVGFLCPARDLRRKAENSIASCKYKLLPIPADTKEFGKKGTAKSKSRSERIYHWYRQLCNARSLNCQLSSKKAGLQPWVLSKRTGRRIPIAGLLRSRKPARMSRSSPKRKKQLDRAMLYSSMQERSRREPIQ